VVELPGVNGEDGGKRRWRASTMVRARRKSSIEPSVASGSVRWPIGAAKRSVQAAGMWDRLPSGRMRIRQSRPSFCILPRTLSDRPSNG
jgi:hypothetical protein